MPEELSPDHPVDALARLVRFRQSWNDGDVIDEESGLTADDLDAVIARAQEMRRMVSIPYIDLSQGGSFDDLK